MYTWKEYIFWERERIIDPDCLLCYSNFSHYYWLKKNLSLPITETNVRKTSTMIMDLLVYLVAVNFLPHVIWNYIISCVYICGEMLYLPNE